MAEEHYLTRDEYIDSQNHQNGLIRKEFERLDQKVDGFIDSQNHQNALIRKEFERVDRRFDTVDNFIAEQKEHNLAVEKQFERIDRRFEGVDAKFVSIDVRMEQMQAQIRNGRKKNPFLPVEPVPINDLEQGAKYPDPAMFPRNAREFYALRNPTTEKYENMLYYLVSFYDIHPQLTSSRLSSSSTSSASPPSLAKPKNTEKSDNEEEDLEDEEEDSIERTVDKLEDILGLDEERFIAFRKRAHEQWWNEAPVRTKRRHGALSGRNTNRDGEPLPVRRRVSSGGSNDGSSDGSDGKKGSGKRGNNNGDGNRMGFGSFDFSGAGRLAGRISISELMCSVRSRATSSEERSRDFHPHISWREGSMSMDQRRYGPGGRPSSRKSAEKAASASAKASSAPSAGQETSRKTNDGAGTTQVMSTPDSERIRGAGPHRGEAL